MTEKIFLKKSGKYDNPLFQTMNYSHLKTTLAEWEKRL